MRLYLKDIPPDVVPHLSANHGEDKEHGHNAPRVLVQQELQVIPPEISFYMSCNLGFHRFFLGITFFVRHPQVQFSNHHPLHFLMNFIVGICQLSKPFQC